MKNLLFLLLITILCACADNSMKPTESLHVQLNVDRSESFRSTSGPVKVKVVSIEDNRCPMDAVCVWQGIAKVTFELSDDNHAVTSTVFIPEYKDQKSQTNVQLGNDKFRVTLKEVTPYPCHSCSGQPDREAELTVEEFR